MASLVFLAGPIAGRRYELADGEYVIGRRSDCQIFVPDMRVSRQHARLWRDADGWRVEDLGSNNGTFVNGLRLDQPMPVHHDDEITIASTRIRVEARDATPSRWLPPEGNAVTIVEVGAAPVIHSREDSDAALRPLARAGLLSGADQRAVRLAVRLIERKLEALTQLLQATAAADSVSALLDRLADALLELFPQAEHVGVLVEDERSCGLRVHCQRRRAPTPTAPAAGAPDDAPHAAPEAAAHPGVLRIPSTLIEHVLGDRRGVLIGGDPGGGDGGDRGDGGDGGGATGARMGAPLLSHGARYGLVYVEAAREGFHQEDVDLLQVIATQAGLAMHATRMAERLAARERLERDLRVARQIQRNLLPASVPQLVGLDFAVHYEPAYQIGGDFYDFIWHDPTHLGLAVGDVAGKAISAALYMARLTSELRSRAAIARTPARLLRRVNQEMAGLGDDGMFATLVYAIYDLEQRTLVFTNAGHCVPLLRRGGRVFPLEADRAHTPPLGMTPDLDAGEARVQLQPGDLLVIVSDGILEARDAAGAEYGLPRLRARLGAARGGADDVIKAVLADLDAHAGPGAPRSEGDDMTVLAMAIERRRAKRKTTTLPGAAAPITQVGPDDTAPAAGDDDAPPTSTKPAELLD